MSLFNIEIFSQDYEYRDSFQIAELTNEYDYLNIRNSKIKIPKIKCQRGDFIRITQEDSRVCGICDRVSDLDTMMTIEFKPLLKLFDVKVMVNKEEFLSESSVIEESLKELINDTYVRNEDTHQNISGMDVTCITSTSGEKRFEIEESICNLYELIKQSLIKHDIVIETDFDVQEKKIIVSIERKSDYKNPLEADLPNVLDRNFVIQTGDEAINKLTVYDQDDRTNKRTYFLLSDGNISTEKNNPLRIKPVIFDAKEVEVKEGSTLDEDGYKEALNILTREEYDNLIEITVLTNDELVNPQKWNIGDKGMIIHNGCEYHSILTGRSVNKNRTKLIFGAVRLELTKILKRRIG